jgi:hypothetical protein
LYPGCKNATKVSFIVELFQIKCMYGLSNAVLDAILKLFGKVLPEGRCIPDSLDKKGGSRPRLGLCQDTHMPK